MTHKIRKTNNTRIIQRGYKTELKLNNQQQTLCRRHAGCARFAYNWGLQRKIAEYEKTGKSPTAIDLHRELNRLKKTEFSWMYEVSKCAPQEALRNLDNAFRHFFHRVRKGSKPGFPKFKSRKLGMGAFRLTGIIRVFKNSIQLPRLGKLRLKEHGYLPSESDHIHILSATISEKAGRWFVSLQVQEEITVVEKLGPVVGVDVGIQRLATVSDGTLFENPRALSQYERKLKRVQQKLARKRRGSKNSRRVQLKLQKLHSRIGNIRKDALHKATTWLAKTKSVVIIEGLNVAGLKQNHRLAKALSDASFYEFRRQLEYKTHWYGSKLLIAPRFFPSSKMCSGCGDIKTKLALSTRVYRCDQCGLTLNRDLNASYNLELVAASWAETENACLEAGGYRSPVGQCPSMKQEPNTIKGP
ncbi:MAG: RNA-guided endonuclease InsQ/TnpB family protein [Promethearchaeota archaeon]